MSRERDNFLRQHAGERVTSKLHKKMSAFDWCGCYPTIGPDGCLLPYATPSDEDIREAVVFRRGHLITVDIEGEFEYAVA